jgi:hypothetical protein
MVILMFSSIHLPSFDVNLKKFQEDRVHGFWVQAADRDFDDGKHPPGREKKVNLVLFLSVSGIVLVLIVLFDFTFRF